MEQMIQILQQDKTIQAQTKFLSTLLVGLEALTLKMIQMEMVHMNGELKYHLMFGEKTWKY